MLQPVAQLADMRHSRQMNIRQLAGRAHADDSADIFRPGAPTVLLMTAAQQRAKARSPAQIEAAYAFWSVKLMRRAGKHVDAALTHGNRHFAHHLYRIAVKQRPLFMGQLRHFADREKHPGFVIRPHHADQRDARAERRAELRHVQRPLAIHRDAMNPVALALQVLAGRQRRRMFDRAGDNFAPLRLQGDGRGDGGGGSFGGAGGKDDLAGILRAQQRRGLLMRAFQSRLGRYAKIVYR